MLFMHHQSCNTSVNYTTNIQDKLCNAHCRCWIRAIVHTNVFGAFKWHYSGFHHMLGVYIQHINYAVGCSYTRKTVKQTSSEHNECVTLHYNLCPKYFAIPFITVLITLKVPTDMLYIIMWRVSYFNHIWNVNKVTEVPKYKTSYTSNQCFLRCNM
jgi:hypothetical protein